MLKAAAEGEWDKVFGQVAYYTDVQDAARPLVAAVTLPSIVNERIFAYCQNSTWNELRCKIRLISSKGEKLVKGEDQAVEERDLSNADGPIKRAEGILREIGQQGFASEEDILRYFLDCLRESHIFVNISHYRYREKHINHRVKKKTKPRIV
ncbi:hypothetical protein Forpe1208_v000043 [Fusarium oxysporum f. sp. rapae]|uniref:Uncharacterized protein n=1 Tax=Fusarium oxysporum f. sp. rapae TaxID=485398 RepID=A0A8J5TZ95_FUSOX|nr:hypothetical protein Forpe1208_v000043 [Fusarium oxysporum f. sp. rapae]